MSEDLWLWLVVGLVLVPSGWRVWMHQRASVEATASGAPRCVACESVDLEWTAEACYRCRACGHEGGEGRAALAREERRHAIGSWSEERQRAFAAQRWREAGHALDEAFQVAGGWGVGTALADAAVALTPSVADDGDFSDEAYTRAARAAQEAAEALFDVSCVYPDAPPFEVPFRDVEPGDFTVELRQYGDRFQPETPDLFTVSELRAAMSSLASQRQAWEAWALVTRP